MTTLRARRLSRDEDGAVAVMAGASLVVLLLFASYVIDLGFMRSDRIASQSIADMAAAAGAVDYTPGTTGEAVRACLDALAFATTNLGEPAVTEVTSCAVAFPLTFDDSCDATSPQTAEYTTGPYTIFITIPVPDDDPRMAEHLNPDPNFDGRPCQRIGVEILRTRDFILGPVAGFFSSSTQRGAVARSYTGQFGEDYASLVVLQRSGCKTLSVNSGSQIRVFDLLMDDGERLSGNITVDTQQPATGCPGGSKIINFSGAADGEILASGRLVAHSLATTDPSNNYTYDPSVPESRLTPPEPGPIQTRANVDHRANCKKAGYPDGETWSPQRFGQPIDACPDTGPDRAFIEELQDALDPVTASTAGWVEFPQAVGLDCTSASGTFTPADVGGSTRLFIGCNGFAPSGTLALNGFSHILFAGGVDVGGGRFEINGPASTGTVAYVRTAGVHQNSGQLLWRNVFTYIDAPTGNTAPNPSAERLAVTGSTDLFAAAAPLDPDGCNAAGTPNAACFAPLALWSNGRAEHSLLGAQSGGVIGSMFTPNGGFRIRGSNDLSTDPCTEPSSWDAMWDLISSGTVTGLNLEAAQFFAHSIDGGGNSAIRMCPNPESNIPTPLSGRTLIR